LEAGKRLVRRNPDTVSDVAFVAGVSDPHRLRRLAG
jgi:hypothetical protein